VRNTWVLVTASAAQDLELGRRSRVGFTLPFEQHPKASNFDVGAFVAQRSGHSTRFLGGGRHEVVFVRRSS
jgi:hypothetical protein